MQIHELSTSSEAWQNALGTNLRYQVPKIFPLSSTLCILERVAGKICIHLSQFSETEALCSKNISIMPALWLMLQIQYYDQNYAGIIRQTLFEIEQLLMTAYCGRNTFDAFSGWKRPFQILLAQSGRILYMPVKTEGGGRKFSCSFLPYFLILFLKFHFLSNVTNLSTECATNQILFGIFTQKDRANSQPPTLLCWMTLRDLILNF